MLLGILLTPGWADDAQRAWEAAQEALLVEALDGDLRGARDAYQAALRATPAGHPILAVLGFRLGRVSHLLGDDDLAREALDECIRSGSEKGRCLDLRGRIDLDADAVHSVPLVWEFEDAHHGFLHPRAYWDQGSMSISEGEGSWLVWQTQVDGNREDRLIVGFRDPRPPPKVIRVRAMSVHLDAAVALRFEDIGGRVYAPPGRFLLPRGALTDITVRVADLVPEGGGGPPDPSRLHRMTLVDVTALLGVVGENELRIDTFEVR